MNPGPALRVLFIGDNLELCREATGSFTAENMNALIARDSAEALVVAQGGSPDLVVIDLDRSNGDGLALLRKLKMEPGWRDTPVIALTGTDRPDDISGIFDAGACDYLTKPLNPAELAKRVHAAIRSSASVARRSQTSRELEAAQIAAEGATRSRMEVLATQADSLGNLLAAQSKGLEALGAMDLRPEQREAVQSLQEANGALGTRLQYLFDFVRVECGALELNSTEFYLAEVLEAVVQPLQKRAAEKKIKLTFHINSNLPRSVIGDEHRIEVVLRDIIGSFLDFGKSSEIRVEIASQERKTQLKPKPPGEKGVSPTIELKATLTQKGGVLPSELGSLSHSISQFHHEALKSAGSRALDLGLAKRLVELMGGHIWIDNSAAQSVTAHIRIPLGLAGELSPVAPGKAPERSDTSFSRRYPLRLLLVEDNPVNQDLTSRMLEKLGYKVKVAGSGLEAIEALEKHDYDLVFMDLQMPGLDGYETARQINARWAGDKRPTLIALSAHSLHDERKKCFDAGLVDFVAKPVDLETLRGVIEEWAEVRNGNRKPPSQLAGGAPAPAPVEKQAGPARLVDLDRLLHFTGNNLKSVRDLLDFYFRQTAQQLEQMRAALEKGSAQDIRRSAHTLVGSSGTCGMETVVPLLKDIERLSSQGQMTELRGLYEKTLKELDRVKAYLKERLPEGPEKIKDAAP